MHINLFLIPFVIILGLLFVAKDNQNNRRLYIILCSSVLLFVAAMRSPEYMTETYSIDSLNYKSMFEQSFDTTWTDVWSSVGGRVRGLNDDSDIGYVVLNKAIGLFTHEFYVFSLLVDLLFFIPFGIILYRFSNNILQLVFAFVFYISLIQVYLIGGGRQMFAIGLDMMALLSIIDGRKIRTIIFIILGVSIHFSSLLFLIPIVLIWLNVKPLPLKILHIVCFILFPIVLLFPNQIISYMGEFVGSEHYAEYGRKVIQGGTTTFIFLIELLSLFCLVSIKETDLKENKYMIPFYVMAPFFTFFSPLIRSNGTMIRIALYFFTYLVLLVPFGIECTITKNRRIIYYAVILSLAALALRGGGISYYFFWQV